MLRVMGVPFSNSACDYYRVEMPIQAMYQAGLAEGAIVPEIIGPTGIAQRRVRLEDGILPARLAELEAKWGNNIAALKENIRYETYGPAGENFDVTLFTRRHEAGAQYLIKRFREAGRTVVYDIDDDAFAVPPMNPAYQFYGTVGTHILKWYRWAERTPPFKPSDYGLGVGSDAKIKFIGREERKAGYDDAWIKAAELYNAELLNGLKECCRLADAVTVTTPALQRVYSQFNKRVYVLPNQMKLSDWVYNQPLKRPRGEVWFGWAGSATHYDDLKPLEKAINTVLNAVPNAKFVVLGFPQLLDYMPTLDKKRVRVFDFKPINEYRSILAAMNVVWAPSQYNRFNMGKSDIRVLEAWMTPAPVVASETTYGDTVRASKGGGYIALSDKDWIRHTVTLLRDPAHARKMAEAGFVYTYQNRLYENQAYRWAELYEKLHAEVGRERSDRRSLVSLLAKPGLDLQPELKTLLLAVTHRRAA